MEENKQHYGLIAEFKTVSGVMNAAEKIRDEGFTKWDVLTPFPVHGLDAAMGLKRSKVPFFTFVGGLTGMIIGILMVWYMNAYDYPLTVGGKPFFSPIFPFPIFYELTILLAAFGTFFGMFITNKLPMHHHPLFEHFGFNRATDDHFWIVIETSDPKFNFNRIKTLLAGLGGLEITLLENK